MPVAPRKVPTSGFQGFRKEEPLRFRWVSLAFFSEAARVGGSGTTKTRIFLPKQTPQPLRKNRGKTLKENKFRSAPKGRQQMGETGFCKTLRFSAVSCENLRFPAVFCANLRLPNPLIYRAGRKSAKICENVCSGSGFSLLLSPFWRALKIPCKKNTEIPPPLPKTRQTNQWGGGQWGERLLCVLV